MTIDIIMKDDLNKILKFTKARDWQQFHLPKNLAISLAVEAAEVLELFQWTKDGNLPKGKKEALVEELADVYYFLLLLSNAAGIDLKKALEKKMRKNEKRYPVSKAKGSSKKYSEL